MSRMSDNDLQPVVETSIKVGEANDRFRISLAKQAIETLYRDSNFPFAHVDIDANNSPKATWFSSSAKARTSASAR